MFGPLTPDLDAAVMRNVALALRLRRTIAKLHQAAADHTRSVHWAVCPHADCQAAVDLLAVHRVCEQCGESFRLTRNPRAHFCGRCNALGPRAAAILHGPAA